MKAQSVIVIDNFYDDPNDIREHALSLNFYKKENATYPGLEAVSDRDWEPTRLKLAEYINDDVTAPGLKNPPFAQGKFRIAIKEDEYTRLDKVHVDQQKYSGIVYLTSNELCQGGVAFYQHKNTKEVTFTEKFISHPELLFLRESSGPEQIKEQLFDYFKNNDSWEKIGEIPMRFNRAVIIMARVFHGSTGIFGECKYTGRLTQHFEFYTHE